jgi:alkylhydroperoxidase family enzyme
VARINIPEGEGGDAAQVWMMRPEMAGAAGKMSEAAYKRSKLPAREREVARMRIAQINDCPI